MSLIELCISAYSATQAEEKLSYLIPLTHKVLAEKDLQAFQEERSRSLEPGFPERPEWVHPRDLKKRGFGSELGRATLVHAITHIEFNAINLALDAALRFSGLPTAYYADWITVALDEARHFSLLSANLQARGYHYGDFPAHHGLWDMAERTAHDLLDRMAMVPRILEARGLDVTPAMIAKFQGIGDTETADLLAIILKEEIAHVEAGTRWFTAVCEQRELQPSKTWTHLVNQYLGSDVRCPTNIDARQQAGFQASELQWLKDTCRQAAISKE